MTGRRPRRHSAVARPAAQAGAGAERRDLPPALLQTSTADTALSPGMPYITAALPTMCATPCRRVAAPPMCAPRPCSSARPTTTRCCATTARAIVGRTCCAASTWRRRHATPRRVKIAKATADKPAAVQPPSLRSPISHRSTALRRSESTCATRSPRRNCCVAWRRERSTQPNRMRHGSWTAALNCLRAAEHALRHSRALAHTRVRGWRAAVGGPTFERDHRA